MADPFRAEVVNIADPQGLGRVMISCLVERAEPNVWALVLRTDPTTPPPVYQPGDIVLILLEGGDPTLPIVIGALSSRA